MPTPKTIKKHKGIVRVIEKRLSNGTKLRVYLYGDQKIAVSEKGKNRGTQR